MGLSPMTTRAFAFSHHDAYSWKVGMRSASAGGVAWSRRRLIQTPARTLDVVELDTCRALVPAAAAAAVAVAALVHGEALAPGAAVKAEPKRAGPVGESRRRDLTGGRAAHTTIGVTRRHERSPFALLPCRRGAASFIRKQLDNRSRIAPALRSLDAPR
jgi:hypothetical protein